MLLFWGWGGRCGKDHVSFAGPYVAVGDVGADGHGGGRNPADRVHGARWPGNRHSTRSRSQEEERARETEPSSIPKIILDMTSRLSYGPDGDRTLGPIRNRNTQMATRTRRLSKVIDANARSLTLVFLGEKDSEGNPTVNDTLVFSLSDYPKAIVTHLALHGLGQVLGDEISGIGADGGDPVEMVKARNAPLVNGDWSAGREIDRSILVEATMAVFAKAGVVRERAKVEAYINGLDAKEVAKYRRRPDITVAVAAIREARGQTGDDLGALIPE